MSTQVIAEVIAGVILLVAGYVWRRRPALMQSAHQTVQVHRRQRLEASALDAAKRRGQVFPIRETGSNPIVIDYSDGSVRRYSPKDADGYYTRLDAFEHPQRLPDLLSEWSDEDLRAYIAKPDK